MGIQVEFNPDLALRNIAATKNGRKVEECIPEKIEIGATYPFLERGQRNYWLHGEIPLLETAGEGKLSLPLASIIILEARHILDGGEVWTSGTYKVVEIFTDDRAHFNGFTKV